MVLAEGGNVEQVARHEGVQAFAEPGYTRQSPARHVSAYLHLGKGPALLDKTVAFSSGFCTVITANVC